jgi:hypothetical protein
LIEVRRKGVAREFCFWLLCSREAFPVDRVPGNAGRSQSLLRQTVSGEKRVPSWITKMSQESMDVSKGSCSQTLLKIRGWNSGVVRKKETLLIKTEETEQGLETRYPLNIAVGGYIYLCKASTLI